MKATHTLRLLAVLAILVQAGWAAAQGRDWPTHGGDPGGTKHSELAEIDRSNVSRLVRGWAWETGEKPLPPASVPIPGQVVAPGKLQATPIVLDGVMYLSTSYSRVVALDAATGKELWSYDPKAYEWGRLPRGCGFCHRGVAVWIDGDDRRIFINSRWMLIALDAVTGEPVASFGTGGEVDLTENLVWDTSPLLYTNTSPPVVYEDLVIVGSGVPDGRIFRRNPPGDVQAFDARTGKFVWSFHATLTAFDLDEGALLWQVPLGDSPAIRNHPLLKDLDLPPLGVAPPQHGQGGPLVTDGGLVFISATSEYLHVYDKSDGTLLTQFPLDGGGFGNPITYLVGGTQYVAIASSRPDGSEAKIISFRLPR